MPCSLPFPARIPFLRSSPYLMIKSDKLLDITQLIDPRSNACIMGLISKCLSD